MVGHGRSGRGGKQQAPRPKPKPTTPPPDVGLRRLTSARGVNECVEQFHVFSLDAPVDTLCTAFEAYRDTILNALKLRRVSSGDNLEADILLINSRWDLEESCATNNMYRQYLPAMSLRRVDGPSLEFEAPRQQDGVAIYAVWASHQKRPGVALAKDVKKNGTTYFCEELNDRPGYKLTNVGDMYKSAGATPPPYRTILSAPIVWTRKAHAAPLQRPELECIGVLNITHKLAIGLNHEDCAWAQTCASLVGSLHASFFARYRQLEDMSKYAHPNEVILEWSRGRRAAERPTPAVVTTKTISQLGAVMTTDGDSDDEAFSTQQLKNGRITPWRLLTEADFKLEITKLDDHAEKNILDRLQAHGVVLLRFNALTPSNDLLKSLENLLGPACTEQNDYNGKIKMIEPDPDKEAVSGDSAKELAAHVDGTQDTPLPPAMLAFQYLQGATHGGHSTFFDMADVLGGFSANERTEIITDLAQTDAAECTKDKKQSDGSMWVGSFKGALIKPVLGDAAVSVRVRFDRVMKIAAPYQASFNKLQAAVLARGQDSRITFLPREGDVAIFDNWRVMHGRLEVSGRHVRHHNRIWFRDLASRHKATHLLGVRGLSLAQLHAVKQAAKKPKT